MPAAHVPVLLDEVLRVLDPRPGQTAVDCTAGLGGHAAPIADRLGPTGTLILFDLDPGNLAASKARVETLPAPPRVHAIHANFGEVAQRTAQLGLAADLILADLGFASSQVEDPARGLSFSRDGPLDMRLDPDGPVTAAQLIATLSERDLADLIYEYGEERHSRRIAQKVIESRRDQPITTTGQLAAIIHSAVGRPPGAGIDPATRTFQALRIAVNDEVANLCALLDSVERGARVLGRKPAEPCWLALGCRVGIISFHSLEDRPVKQCFGRLADDELAEHIARKPIVATGDEIARNPRSRSAKLRAIRVAHPPG